MEINRKITLVIGISVFCFITALFFISATILNNSYAQLEETSVRESLNQAVSTLRMDLNDLDRLAYDYAARDDTYAFVKHPTETHLMSSPVDDTFVGNRVQLILILNETRSVVAGKAFDIEQRRDLSLPENFRQHLTGGSPLISYRTPEDRTGGIILFGDMPMLFASRPIVMTENKGPVRGSVIVGRFIDAAEIDRLNRLTVLKLSGYRVDDIGIPPEVLLKTGQNGAVIVPLNHETVSGYTLIRDTFGAPALVLRLDMPRDISLQGEKVVGYFLVVLILIGLMVLALTLLLLNTLVISRITGLVRSVKSITEQKNLSGRVVIQGNDELARLGEAINTMLATIEGYNRQLVESKDRYQMLFDGGNDAIIVNGINDDGMPTRFIEVNEVACRMLGYSREELLGCSPQDVIDPAWKERVKSAIRKVTTSGHATFELSLMTKQGTFVPMEVNARFFLLQGQRAVLAIARDITERKISEEDLRIKEAAIESSLNAILLTRLDGRIIYVNTAFVTMWRYANKNEVLMQPVNRLWHPETRFGEVHDALKYQGRWEGEADAVRKDGSLFSVFASMSMVSDDAGMPMYVMVSCIDISSEKAAEEELQQHNRYLGLINQIIGAAQTGATERVLIETLLNRTIDLLNIDGGLLSLVNPDEATVTIQLSAGFPQAFIQQLQTVNTREEPFSRVFINGDVLHIPLDTDAARADERFQILLNEGFHCLLCVPIVTDHIIIGAIGLASRKIRSCSYEELQIFRSIGREFGSTITQVRLREELENTAREANLYIDILAHDINNINMAIRMYTELLLDSLDPDGTAAARKIIANVTQSAEILQNVTTIRRMHHESLQLRSVPLDPVIRDAVGQFSDGGKIVYNGCLSVVIADEMLPDIFRNLIVNAIKYGGPDVAIIIGVREEAEEVTISVEDTGPGISDAMKEEIFSRFQNRKRGASGRGLGLYIVKSLVERYGGRVWADNRVPGSPEKGAAIRFTLRRP